MSSTLSSIEIIIFLLRTLIVQDNRPADFAVEPYRPAIHIQVRFTKLPRELWEGQAFVDNGVIASVFGVSIVHTLESR